MTESELNRQPYEKTQDYTTDPAISVCVRGSYRIGIFEQATMIPIVIASDTRDSGDAVSPVTGQLAAEVLLRHFTTRLWEKIPMLWFEEEARRRKDRGKIVDRREFWEVTFRSYIPQLVRIFGDCLTLQEASRHPVKTKELEVLLGQLLSDD